MAQIGFFFFSIPRLQSAVNSRGEGVVLLYTSDALTFPLLVRGLGLVVEVELVQPVSEGQKNL